MDYSQLLSYSMETPVLVALGVTLFCVVVLLAFWLPYVGRVGRTVREQTDPDVADSKMVDEVSVIVYANNDGATIEALLNEILTQEMVGTMEVIVVNDGSYDATHDIVGRLEMTHSNLYLTYAPDNSRNLSRRKLALTLGIKAARYEKIVFTTANATIGSKRWLRDMAAPLDAGADIVLGYAYPDVEESDHGAKRIRAFDTVWEAVSWLAPAIGGSPTRGIGSNLAYKRQLFFDNKGFSQTLNLINGDDDIFISEIAQGRTTAVAIAEQDQVGLNQWDPAAAHRANKLSRRFTGKRIASWPRMRMAAGPWMAWGALAGGIVGGWLGWPSAVPAAIALVLLLAAWIPVMVVWRRTSVALHSRRLLLTVIPLLYWHPFYDLKYAIRGSRTRKRNFTWSEFDK